MDTVAPTYLVLAAIVLFLVLFLLLASPGPARVRTGASVPCPLHQWEWLERAFRCRRCGLVCDSQSIASRREL